MSPATGEALGSARSGAATLDHVFCHNCGHRNPEGVNFCSSCGASMVTSAPDTSVSVSPVEDLHDSGDGGAPVGQLELPRGVGLLVVRRGNDEGARFPLENGETTVGRHPDSDVFLDDVTVSRKHAVFVTEDQVTTVRDCGSLNGTYVNRERIEEATLASGDEVQVGKFKLVYLRGAVE
ncbi:MAG: FHA domain-containing protein [Acidimicrobiales bacterium]